MKVFITGATGLVGAHTALELLERGHEVRLLVRNRSLATRYFSDKGYKLDDLVEGDMRDAGLVSRSLQGCDAVVHSAAMVSLDPKLVKQVYASNVDSINAVLGSAVKAGINNILYVSSLGALFTPCASSVNENSPLGISREAYSRSKRDCEQHVRKMQADGAPIQISYPAGVFGPDDPKISESNEALVTMLKVVPQTTSGIQCVDARDVAAVHCEMLENAPQSGYIDARYIVGGWFYPWEEFHSMLERITGRRIFAPHINDSVLRVLGSFMDVVKRMVPVPVPVSSESMSIVTQWPPADSGRVMETFGVEFRSGDETFADTIRWLAASGHIKPSLAGILAQGRA